MRQYEQRSNKSPREFAERSIVQRTAVRTSRRKQELRQIPDRNRSEGRVSPVSRPQFRGLSHELMGDRSFENIVQEKRDIEGRSLQQQAQLQQNPEAQTSTEKVAGDRMMPSESQGPNKTGLPDRLKAGIETLSGMPMDDVKVHYNSSKPSELQALAYTQGTDIHVGPGQEKHLSHEAWHVVQQKQGRVLPTMQLQGMEVNNDSALEHEAEVKGKQASLIRDDSKYHIEQTVQQGAGLIHNTMGHGIAAADERAQEVEADSKERQPAFFQMKSIEGGSNFATSRTVVQATGLTRYPKTGSSGGRPKRDIKPGFNEEVLKEPRFLNNTPKYQKATNPAAGGKESTATLRPGGFTGGGTDADSKLPKAIEAARKKYPSASFKAGHLLNADFGGNGKDPKNLTILTATANSNHKKFDDPIKKVGDKPLKEAYKALHNDNWDITKATLGIKITVKVDEKLGTWHDSEFPDDCINNGLICSAEIDEGNTKDITFNEDKNKADFNKAMAQLKQDTKKANDNKTVNNKEQKPSGDRTKPSNESPKRKGGGGPAGATPSKKKKT